MGTPAAYLPPALSSELISEFIKSLDLPTPTSIQALQVAAQFHSIYLIQYAKEVAPDVLQRSSLSQLEADGTVSLVLRVSGRHLPHVKTLNEVGVMYWVRENTEIPVPKVVRFDAFEDNLIGHEFTLLEKAPGVSIDSIYDTLSSTAKANLVEQLLDYLIQLHQKSWESGYVGGLTLQGGNIANGPPIDEYFWQLSDIKKYWGPGESVESLNPIQATGYDSYTSFIVASVEKYIYALEKHESLVSFRDLIPRLRTFNQAISSPRYAPELNKVKYILAHKDLHFANIMCDPADPSGRITAILDWEFSGVVPAPRWNPPRAFLWNAKDSSEESKAEQEALEQVFEEKAKARGASYLLEDAKLTGLQEPMQTLVSYLRAIVEVCPRGQAQDRVEQWKSVVETSLEAFEV